MKVRKIEAQHLCTIEYVIWQVSIKNKTINILGIYHPPPKQDLTNTTFLDELTELLTTRLPNMENAIILGDFNMHIEDPNDYNSKIFVDMMEALGLRQHVVEPTHQKGNILDLIFTETTSQINVSQLNMLDFISDHRLISATINVKKDILKITRKEIRNFKEVSPAMMMENFHPPHLRLNTNTSKAHTQFTLQLQEMLDKCVPEKIIKRPKTHKTSGSMISFDNSIKLLKIGKEPGENMGSSTTGRHTQLKETNTFTNSTTLNNNQSAKESWTAKITPKNSSSWSTS